MTDVRLIVANRAYSSWKAISVTRSIESVSGSFSLTVSDRRELAVREEDPCRVEVGDETLIDGFVETRSITTDANSREVTFAGFDKVQALVANSVLLDRWTFRDTDLLAFARALARPLGVSAALASGLQLPPAPEKVVVNPGDSAFDAIVAEATKAGVLLVSDGAGGLLLTQGGKARAQPIVEGDNLLAGSISYNGAERYHRYVVLAQRPGSDTSSGSATQVRAEAIDTEVRRTDRVLVIRPSTKMTVETARAHADWQARTRAAQAETVNVTVRRWQQRNGTLWPVNHITRIQAPGLGVDGDMLIAEPTYTLNNNGGEIVRMRLVRPDAFTPDPAATVKGAAEWKI